MDKTTTKPLRGESGICPLAQVFTNFNSEPHYVTLVRPRKIRPNSTILDRSDRHDLNLTKFYNKLFQAYTIVPARVDTVIQVKPNK